jgi:hypothetical protein
MPAETKERGKRRQGRSIQRRSNEFSIQGLAYASNAYFATDVYVHQILGNPLPKPHFPTKILVTVQVVTVTYFRHIR